MCPEKINLFKAISLSAWAVTQKVEDVGSIINSHRPVKQFGVVFLSSWWIQILVILLSCLSQCFFYLKWLKNQPLLIVYVECENNFKKTENTNSVQPDVKYTEVCYIPWWLKTCVGQRGLVRQIYKACENISNMWKFKAYDYSLYYSAANILWKYLNVSCVIEAVMSTVNLIYSCGFFHRPFCKFLTKTKAQYPDCSNTQHFDNWTVVKFVSFCKKGKMETFLKEKNCPQPFLVNTGQLQKLDLDVDLVMFLN